MNDLALSGLPGAIRAASTMPASTGWWEMDSVLCAFFPGDDAEGPAEAAAELLRHALSWERPLPFLRMAAAAAHLAAERLDARAWEASDRPPSQPSWPSKESRDWRGAHEAAAGGQAPEATR